MCPALHSLTEFVTRVRGGMPEKRIVLVEMAFKILDKDGSGVVTIADIAGTYNVDMHPKARQRLLSRQKSSIESAYQPHEAAG